MTGQRLVPIRESLQLCRDPSMTTRWTTAPTTPCPGGATRSMLAGDDVIVEIADTGGGVPPELHGKIFEPFFTTKPIGRGTGQGLAIARSTIVDKHGGTLTFTSEPGRGTVFRVSLPVNGKTQHAQRADHAAPPLLR